MTDRPPDSQLRDQALIRQKFVKQLNEDNFVLYSQAIVPAAANSADPPIIVEARRRSRTVCLFNFIPPETGAGVLNRALAPSRRYSTPKIANPNEFFAEPTRPFRLRYRGSNNMVNALKGVTRIQSGPCNAIVTRLFSRY